MTAYAYLVDELDVVFMIYECAGTAKEEGGSRLQREVRFHDFTGMLFFLFSHRSHREHRYYVIMMIFSNHPVPLSKEGSTFLTKPL